MIANLFPCNVWTRNDFDGKKDNIVTDVRSRRRQNLDVLFLDHRKVIVQVRTVAPTRWSSSFNQQSVFTQGTSNHTGLLNWNDKLA